MGKSGLANRFYQGSSVLCARCFPKWILIGVSILNSDAFGAAGTIRADFSFGEQRFGPPVMAFADGSFLTPVGDRLLRFKGTGQRTESWVEAIDSVGAVHALEVASDGAIFAAGVMNVGGQMTHLVKLAPDGSLDPDFPPGEVALATQPFGAGIALVRPDADGGCYVHGYFDLYDGKQAIDLIHVDRTGHVTPWLRDRAIPLGGGWELVPDGGTLIVVGPDRELNRVYGDGTVEPFTRPGGIQWRYIAGAAFDPRWGLAIVGSPAADDPTKVWNICAVYERDGNLKSSFGQHVIFDVITGGGDCIAWDNHGRLLLGYATVLEDDDRSDGDLFGLETNLTGFGPVVFTPSVKRLLPDGRLDPEWSRALWFNLGISRLAVLPDDDVLVGGTFSKVCGHVRGPLVRLCGDNPRQLHPQQSARGYVEAGRQELIMGLIIDGDRAVDVLVRAAGPSLRGFGVRDTAFNTHFTVYRGPNLFVRSPHFGGEIVPIDWAADRVGAFPFSSGGATESVMLLSLLPGAYTVVIGASDEVIGFGGKGEVLGEVYFP